MQVQNKSVPTMEKNQVSPQKDLKAENSEKTGKNDGTVGKTDPNQEPKSAEEKTSMYLKVASRLENMMKEGAIPKNAVEGFTNAIKKRLEELGEQEKKGLMLLPEIIELNLKRLIIWQTKSKKDWRKKRTLKKYLSCSNCQNLQS